MTTRITLAILLTTWVILIIGETAAFLTARQSLLALLDDTIITRANRLLDEYLEPKPDTGRAIRASVPAGDRYSIRERADQVINAPLETIPQRRHNIVKARFETIDGKRFRTVELKTYVYVDDSREPVSITYSRPAEKFDSLLGYLAKMLLLISLSCGLVTAWLALKLSRAALRPLRETADVIAQIDEQQLAMRLKTDDMPVELSPMGRRLNEMLARLQNVFQQRKQFLADAAHELRTPTASLLTTMEVALRRPRDQAELTEALRSGLADTRRLRKLVESLMEQARSERARVQSPEPTNISELLRECVQIVTPLAREKDVVITQEIPDHIQFSTERDRLRSVVLNLLSNAVEYNKHGGKIHLSASRENGTLTLAVADTGEGISAEQVPHVFEPFYRGGTTGRGDDAEHLGLGLFLVQSHVRSMHGEVFIESKIGDGTTMRVTLPEPRTGAAAGAASSAARADGGAAKPSASAAGVTSSRA